MTTRTTNDADRFLRIYLQDHLAGANAGVALLGRCRRANQEPQLDDVLAGIEQEFIEDGDALTAMMSRLGFRPHPVKSALGVVSEMVGRLKLNGRLVRYSPSRRVVELEALGAGVVTKRNMWRALRVIAEARSALDADELDDLIERATTQLDRIVAVHPSCAHEAFATEPSKPSNETMASSR